MDPADLIADIFKLSPNIRYVALYRGGDLTARQREDLTGASGAESDRYEELLVNPAILLLARQRGDIDCGGARFVVVRYGNFFQFVMPLSDGHASVCFELAGDPIAAADAILRICETPRALAP